MTRGRGDSRDRHRRCVVRDDLSKTNKEGELVSTAAEMAAVLSILGDVAKDSEGHSEWRAPACSCFK